MRRLGILLFLFASSCYAQEVGSFQPSETNVWGAEYPRVDSAGRAQIRVKAPDATKVKVNFWSGPKVDMEKQSDGYWMVTTPPPCSRIALLHRNYRWSGGERPWQSGFFWWKQVRERNRGA